jgi:hypothetical protein
MSENDMNYVREVCKIGRGHECCRYLVCGQSGFECMKKTEGLREYIDQRALAGQMTARADNCAGMSGLIVARCGEK